MIFGPIQTHRRWAVFISGRGSNLQSWLDEVEISEVQVVISSSIKAAGLLKAKRFGIPILVIKNPIQWQELQKELELRKITHVMLAGFMKVVPEEFLKPWDGKIFNLHPSLLPQFPGLHALEKSFEAKAALGVSLHEVVPEMDAGPLLMQKALADGQFPSNWNLTEVQLRVSLAEQQMMKCLYRSGGLFGK